MEKRKEKIYHGLEDETPEPIVDNGIIVDPYGSYTGVVLDNPFELPVQDVDDL